MRIRISLFAHHRQVAGVRRVEVEVPDGATVLDAWNALLVAVPALAAAASYSRFARNGVYVSTAEAVRDGDEVAVVPPISGGGGTGAPGAGMPTRSACPTTGPDVRH
jgi:molybdopterin converting factor small subunit